MAVKKQESPEVEKLTSVYLKEGKQTHDNTLYLSNKQEEEKLELFEPYGFIQRWNENFFFSNVQLTHFKKKKKKIDVPKTMKKRTSWKETPVPNIIKICPILVSFQDIYSFYS